MRVYSKNIGISLVVAGLLLSGCEDVTNIYIDENKTDENLSVENLIVDNLTVNSLTVLDEDENQTEEEIEDEIEDDKEDDDDNSTEDSNLSTDESSSELKSYSETPTSSDTTVVTSNTLDSSDDKEVIYTTPISNDTEETTDDAGSSDGTEESLDTSGDNSDDTKETTDDSGNSDGTEESLDTSDGTTQEDTTTTEPVAETLSMSVTGSVVDGIIYGGSVSVYDLNKKLLAKGSTDSKGAYSIPVANLPKQYKVTLEGGTDSGVDGVENSNDKTNSLEMSAIVDREDSGEESVAHISPATTLVATMVEDGTIPLEEARESVNDALGLDGKSALCKLNPSKNDTAYRAGLFLAMVMESIVTTDKNALFKTLSTVVHQKKIKVKISNVGTTIEQLDLVDIATTANISENEIEKLSQVEVTVKESIKKSIDSMAVVTDISRDSQNEALTQRARWDTLLLQLAENDVIDSSRVSLILDRVEESMQSILEAQTLEASEPSNIALIASMIDENLDKEMTDLTPSLLSISASYQERIKTVGSSETLKLLIRKLYTNSTLAEVDNISTMLQNDDTVSQLEEAIETMDQKVSSEENAQEIKDEMLDTLAGGVASRVESGTIPSDDTTTPTTLKSFIEQTLGDDGLYESIKSVVKVKVKIKVKAKKSKLTQADKSELTASIKVKKSLKITIKSKSYTKIDSSASSDMLAYISSMLASLSDDAYQEKIQALELSLANLSEAFDKAKYEAKVAQSVKVIQKIKVKTTTNIIKTIVKIKVVIKEKFIENPSDTTTAISDVESNIDDYEVGDDIATRIIRLPQPSVESMGDIEKIRFAI